MKSSKLMILILAFCLFSLNSLCFAEDTKKEDTATTAVAKEVSDAKAKIAAGKDDDAKIAAAKAALKSCSAAAVADIARAAKELCPSSSYQDLYAAAVLAHPGAKTTLAAIFNIKLDADGNIDQSLTGGGGIKGFITGQQNNKDEKKASE